MDAGCRLLPGLRANALWSFDSPAARCRLASPSNQPIPAWVLATGRCCARCTVSSSCPPAMDCSDSDQHRNSPSWWVQATPEQRELVARIRRTTCYYEILVSLRVQSEALVGALLWRGQHC